MGQSTPNDYRGTNTFRVTKMTSHKHKTLGRWLELIELISTVTTHCEFMTSDAEYAALLFSKRSMMSDLFMK
ncbi:hypothetical protein SVI_1159 [Shewanella violacea DSS12]|uniref:Uncharacterized protein n=1 Tax=Shewanella violacea (strain JCM 10179 / CIP 106290 / LMG 19151 / DSS12) TaxID=637905 RepID=D4ZHI1_SHEVD|nr:hypothetical protein SVI_1159 [Shewanella violacea DSS12]